MFDPWIVDEWIKGDRKTDGQKIINEIKEIKLRWLKSLPIGIFNGCESLSKVDLGVNKLKSLPVGIFNECKVLKYVYLQSNQLSSLPDGLFDGCES